MQTIFDWNHRYPICPGGFQLVRPGRGVRAAFSLAGPRPRQPRHLPAPIIPLGERTRPACRRGRPGHDPVPCSNPLHGPAQVGRAVLSAPLNHPDATGLRRRGEDTAPYQRRVQRSKARNFSWGKSPPTARAGKGWDRAGESQSRENRSFRRDAGNDTPEACAPPHFQPGSPLPHLSTSPVRLLNAFPLPADITPKAVVCPKP